MDRSLLVCGLKLAFSCCIESGRQNAKDVSPNVTCKEVVFHLVSHGVLVPVRNGKCIQIYANCTPESRIAEVVGRCCRVDVLWELLAASTSVAP